jgi:homogentisate 1,2-dioxygenase
MHLHSVICGLVVESRAPLSLTEHKQVGRHRPVDPTVLVLPKLHDQRLPQRAEWELRVKHGGARSSIFYRNNPLALVGWKGQATGFVVISFVPQTAVVT